MMRSVLIWAFVLPALACAQEMHQHPAPEKLGTVSFPTSCKPAVQQEFERAVALLHSFTYKAAQEAFDEVAKQDPRCAIAHWGSAMTHYHQLWDLPPSPQDAAAGKRTIDQATALDASERERGYLQALSIVFTDAATAPYKARAMDYEAAMKRLAMANPNDVESQVFYALALISNASPQDRSHQRQKEAADILEPLYRRYPDHPGIAHYLIHACDNQEMASRGLPAAKLYASIAPSAPHALHMPSHIFTRLGLWDESVASNMAARDAARDQRDTGEELHAMDYLVYAYLQSGRDQEAAQVIEQLKSMQNLRMSDFKMGYAATAMPIWYIAERHRWNEAQSVADPPEPAAPHVVAIAVWARGMGLARDGRYSAAEKEIGRLQQLKAQLHAAGNSYWEAQVDIMRREVAAWSAQAANRSQDAATLLRKAADDEDAIEKMPVTPGPIVPAREQLGELLLAQGDVAGASIAFKTALINAPGRRGALQGASKAAQISRGNEAASSLALHE